MPYKHYFGLPLNVTQMLELFSFSEETAILCFNLHTNYFVLSYACIHRIFVKDKKIRRNLLNGLGAAEEHGQINGI
jgi:hypothetical protein